MTASPNAGWPSSATDWLPVAGVTRADVPSFTAGGPYGGRTAKLMEVPRPRTLHLTDPSWLGEAITTMHDGIDELHVELIAQLTEVSPAYAELVGSPSYTMGSKARLAWFITSLSTLAAGNRLDTAPLEALAAERRDQGVSLEELREANRLTSEAVWRSYVDAVTALDLDPGEALSRGADLHRRLTEETVGAITSGYLTGSDRRTPGARLIAGLTSPGAPGEELVDLCRQTGMDPGETFLAAVLSGGARFVVPEALRGVAAPLGDLTVVLTQHHLGDLDAAEEELLSCLRTVAPDVTIGVGLSNRGLVGAAASIDEARRAHTAAVRLDDPALRYRSRWTATMALDAEDDVRGVLQPLIEVLESDPELLATARAYLAADGSLTKASEELYLHANTVRYRLVRIGELSGIDVRTMMGGWSLYIALTLALTDEDSEG